MVSCTLLALACIAVFENLGANIVHCSEYMFWMVISVLRVVARAYPISRPVTRPPRCAR